MNFWTLRSTGHLDDLLFQGVFCTLFLSCAQHVFGTEYRGESFSVEVRSRIFLATFFVFCSYTEVRAGGTKGKFG